MAGTSTEGNTDVSATNAGQLDPDAFKKLYPENFYQKYIDNGIRPDGRAFGRARPTTIGLGAVETADASALVKIGSTTVLAGIKLEVLAVPHEPAKEGQLEVMVEWTPLSVGTKPRKRQASEAAAQCCSRQVDLLLKASKAVDLSKLIIGSGEAVWVAYLDIYVLDADGSVLDACLLAAVAALASMKSLPSVAVDKRGGVVKASDDEPTRESSGWGLLEKEQMPVSLTCGVHGEALIVDLTDEEEQLMQSTTTVSLDKGGRLVGLYKPGGSIEASTEHLLDCIELTRLRYGEVIELLEDALNDLE